jgi:GH24 family phage-related lysozyme (muramidase)
MIQRAVDTKLTFDDVYAFIKDHEGYRPHVYNDSRGIPTIGIGLNLLRPDAKKIAAQAGADYDAILSGKQTLTDDQVKELFKSI